MKAEKTESVAEVLSQPQSLNHQQAAITVANYDFWREQLPDEIFEAVHKTLLLHKTNELKARIESTGIDLLSDHAQEALNSLSVSQEELLPHIRRQVQKIEGKKAEVEYAKKVYEPQMEFKPRCYDWRMWREHLCWWYEDNLPKGREIRLTKDYHRIYTQVCKYFAEDPTCEYDLNKGLMLMGCVGDGKTMLMRCFQHNQRYSYKVAPASDIAELYKSHGLTVLDSYRHDQPMMRNRFGHTSYGWCIDDIGAESIYRNFGDPLNVVEFIVTKRYDSGLLTHYTTNLTAEELKTNYGERVSSRLRESVNVIVLPMEDLRK